MAFRGNDRGALGRFRMDGRFPVFPLSCPGVHFPGGGHHRDEFFEARKGVLGYNRLVEKAREESRVHQRMGGRTESIPKS